MSTLSTTERRAQAPLMDEVTRSLLQGRGLVVVSNRGPVQHSIVDGEVRASRGSGGLVTAISSLSRFVPFTWVASALSDGDRHVAERSGTISVPGPAGDSGLFVKYVLNPPDSYQKYYNVYSNPFLWFVQHYMLDLAYDNVDRTVHEAWGNGYVPVNEAFAAAVVKESEAYGKAPVIMIQDYQLYLAAGLIREALPEAIIQHFIHIPWPAPRYWTMLPKKMRESILRSLCACDIVGFQTRRDAENFVATCQDLLPGAEIDLKALTVWHRGRSTYARHYPISIDVGALRAMAQSPRVKQYQDNLEELVAGQTIVRVDRLDPTKNILRGFKAYEFLLSTHLELLGKVTFLAFLVPSRTEIVQYQRYKEAVFESVEKVNKTFSCGGWTPVHLFYEENYAQAIAGMRMADVLLVNPVIDGMNLVAKEAPVVNTRDCALVLSETVGAFEQLKEYVVPVSPTDVEGTADAVYHALKLDRNEKARRLQGLRSSIEREDITYWLHSQLRDLAGVRGWGLGTGV